MLVRLSFYKTLLYLALLCTAIYVQPALAQDSTLSMREILTGLQSTSGDFSPAERLEFIVEQIRVRGVDFKLTEANESALIQAGATSQLIEVIRQESLRKRLSKEQLDTANTFYNDGLTYLKQANYDSAINNFQTAIELNPRLALAYGGLGFAYYQRKDYEKSIEYYNKAIAARSDSVLYLNRAASYFAIGSYDKAVRDYSQVIEKQPDNKNAYLGRGTSYFSNNKCEPAVIDFEKVLELDPNNTTARRRLDLCNKILEKQNKQ